MFRKITIITAVALSMATTAWASCRDDYESDVQQCQIMYSDPDDADDLAQCVQQAKDDFDDCVGE